VEKLEAKVDHQSKETRSKDIGSRAVVKDRIAKRIKHDQEAHDSPVFLSQENEH